VTVPRIVVCNKADLVEPHVADVFARANEGFAVSATDPISLLPLLSQMERVVFSDRVLPNEHRVEAAQ
jgi:50S ribosomal subunit-associated GTPase HflX